MLLWGSPVLVGVWLSLLATSLAAKASEFSHSRDLPPLRLAATDLDTILQKVHSIVAGANGPQGEQGFAQESVKLGVRGKEIEIPHFSLASSVAFPNEVFRFAYTIIDPINRYHPSRLTSTITRAGYRSAAELRIKSRQSQKLLKTICFAIQRSLVVRPSDA